MGGMAGGRPLAGAPGFGLPVATAARRLRATIQYPHSFSPSAAAANEGGTGAGGGNQRAYCAPAAQRRAAVIARAKLQCGALLCECSGENGDDVRPASPARHITALVLREVKARLEEPADCDGEQQCSSPFCGTSARGLHQMSRLLHPGRESLMTRLRSAAPSSAAPNPETCSPSTLTERLLDVLLDTRGVCAAFIVNDLGELLAVRFSAEGSSRSAFAGALEAAAGLRVAASSGLEPPTVLVELPHSFLFARRFRRSYLCVWSKEALPPRAL